MFRKKLPIVFIGLSIIVAALVLSWAVFIKLMPVVPVQAPVVSDDLVGDDDVLDDDISDWNIYRNEEYGFEMKYPEDWEGEEPESSDVLLGAEKTEGGSSYYFTITVRPNYKVDQITSSVKDAEKINIGDHSGYKYFYTEGVGESGVALIQAGKDALSITFDSIGNDQNFATSNDRKIYVQNFLDKILSTFKFIEKDETADWNVYRNEEYGFEFKYPKDWGLGEQILNWWGYIDKPYNPYLFISLGVPEIKEDSVANIICKDGTYEEFVKRLENPNHKITISKDIVFNGKNGKLIKDLNIYVQKESNSIVVEVGKNKKCKIFQPTIENSDYPVSSKYNSIINQILSTFKFIEKDEIINWDNYRFELEDITKAEDFEIDPKTHQLLNNPFHTCIWKIDNETGGKEIFIEDTKKSAGESLMNVGLPELSYEKGKVLQIIDKLYLRPYDAGSDRPNWALWELDLNNRKFKKLEISKFLGDFGLGIWSPDRKRIINTKELENDQIIRVLDITKDSFKVIATTSDDKGFALSSGLCSTGSADWIDNNKIKYRIYDKKDFVFCENMEPKVLEEKIIDIETIPDSEVTDEDEINKN